MTKLTELKGVPPKICTSCILPNGFLGVRLNAEGECDFCADPSHVNPNWSKVQITAERRAKSLEDWNNAVKDMQDHHGEMEFDCVIGYSGGKDSTALVDIFITEYGLNPLCVTIDTGFMTEVAVQNIRNTLAKMHLENNYLYIIGASGVFAKLYRILFLEHNSPTHCLTVKVCELCTKLIHTIIEKEALKRGIPYTILGFSPDQIRQYFYETSAHEILLDGTVPPELIGGLTPKEASWYLSAEEKAGILPRMLYPYHVIPYSEAEIIARIESKGLIEKGKGDPVLTNCHVVKAALMYDLFRYGGLTYALQYAELIRQAPEGQKSHERKKWLRLYSRVGRQILEGNFDATNIQLFLEHIGISRDELLTRINTEVQTDSQREHIQRNLNLLLQRHFK